MDFDRDAIGSLEDLHREWDGLETERAKVEDRLRSFDAAGRGGGPGWRSGGGRGGGRGSGSGGRGHGQAGGGDWSRDRPRESPLSSQQVKKTPFVSPNKVRAMSGTWERGLDPASAAAEIEAEASAAGDAIYRPSPRERGMENNPRGGGGGGATGREALSRRGRGGGEIRSEREHLRPGSAAGRSGAGGGGGIRGERSGNRSERETFWSGSAAAGSRAGGGVRGAGSGRAAGAGAGGGDRREYVSRTSARNGSGNGGSSGGGGGGSGGRGLGEPDAKRPRVTSTIVIAGDDTASLDNGELDRWNSAPGSGAAEGGPEEEAAGGGRGVSAAAADGGGGEGETAMAVEGEEAVARRGGRGAADTLDDESGEANDGVGGDAEKEDAGPRFVSQIVVVPGGARGRAAARGSTEADRYRGEHRFLGRSGGPEGGGGVRQGGGGGGARGGVMRGSLASRLGPPMGRPVMVVAEGEGSDLAPLPRPMTVPSKPELHAAYKDGDTKKRNRRMFGGLIAHLGRARKQLDDDKTLIERQNSVAEMAATRQVQEKRRQRQMALAADRQERDDELHKRDYINARQQKTLLALHGNAFIANQEQLRGYIFTKTLPKLAWTPNEHTDVTQALLAQSNGEINERIAKRKDEDDAAFQEMDDSVAQRVADRASRRPGPEGGRQDDGDRADRVDRDANPYGEGEEHRWRGSTAEQDIGNGVEPSDIGKRRRRAHDDGEHDNYNDNINDNINDNDHNDNNNDNDKNNDTNNNNHADNGNNNNSNDDTSNNNDDINKNDSNSNNNDNNQEMGTRDDGGMDTSPRRDDLDEPTSQGPSAGANLDRQRDQEEEQGRFDGGASDDAAAVPAAAGAAAHANVSPTASGLVAQEERSGGATVSGNNDSDETAAMANRNSARDGEEEGGRSGDSARRARGGESGDGDGGDGGGGGGGGSGEGGEGLGGGDEDGPIEKFGKPSVKEFVEKSAAAEGGEGGGEGGRGRGGGDEEGGDRVEAGGAGREKTVSAEGVRKDKAVKKDKEAEGRGGEKKKRKSKGSSRKKSHRSEK